jgi:Family of unknown function (DUF6352)
VAESCAAELRLHAALHDDPANPVEPQVLATLADADTRENYRHFLAFRDALLAAGSLEGCYLALMRSGRIELPPAFITDLVETVVAHIMAGVEDAYEARAAEMLWRPQRISLQDGQLLAADRDTVDLLGDTGGFGDLGRLLRRGDVPLRTLELSVLGEDNTGAYWQAETQRERRRFVLDLTHEVSAEFGHGVAFKLTRASAFVPERARVLERWVAHMLGVVVRIEPLQKIADEHWRWHIGLDVDASTLLDDLYRGHAVEADRQQRLISLFRLDFANPAEMRADVAGKPVYLGLAHGADGVLKLKPQNLLLNLPLAGMM